MDIHSTILGLLSAKPLSGYDLKKASSLIPTFSTGRATTTRSTTAWSAFSKQGLVSVETFQQESLPPRKVYTITPAGQTALREALQAEPELPEIREPFLIQLAWADRLHGDELDALLARYAEEVTVQIRMRKERTARPHFSPSRTPRERLLWARIEEHQLSRYEHELEWVNRLMQELKEQ